MSALYSRAQRWEFYGSNPISLARQSAKRESTHAPAEHFVFWPSTWMSLLGNAVASWDNTPEAFRESKSRVRSSAGSLTRKGCPGLLDVSGPTGVAGSPPQEWKQSYTQEAGSSLTIQA